MKLQIFFLLLFVTAGKGKKMEGADDREILFQDDIFN